jgi:acyl-CoA thioester hydrolase
MSEAYKSIIPIQIRFSDVDSVGHVSNTQYQNFYDLGKLDYFDRVLPDMDFDVLGVVGASVKIDFILPVYMRTRVLVKTRVTKLGNKSITMEHELCDESSGVLYSTCTAVMVCYDMKSMQSTPIPEDWKQRIEDFELIINN